ncbi:hypothetical protein NL676_005167 [Syzygium grande]|nr:hypothetical protein NL676_005167 [Syzygium grande]
MDSVGFGRKWDLGQSYPGDREGLFRRERDINFADRVRLSRPLSPSALVSPRLDLLSQIRPRNPAIKFSGIRI